MPWTKIKYPDAMKKLPRGERKKIIKKAKALLKENKKQIEELFLNIAIEHIKNMPAKAVKKKKRAAKKKIKVTAKKKITSPVKSKAAGTAKKKIKSPVKRKAAVAAKKKIKSPAKPKAKIAARAKTKKTDAEKIKNPVSATTPPETITHTEDAHSVPGQGGMHPVTTLEAHQIENVFHHREEVSFHQENQKVKAAMATRKNSKRTYRQLGQR
ncbi:MAG: hypothetical protein JJE25_12405 [Bacteroidia bacterium]|nr:hypothetical protein [Bacteroidia bacterium]